MRTFPPIFGGTALPKQFRLQGESFRQGHPLAALDRFHRPSDGQRTVRHDLLGHGIGSGKKFPGPDNPVDQTDAQRLGRIHGVAGQKHLHRLGLADQTRQPLRTAVAGDNSQLHLRLGKAGVLGGDAKRAGHGKLAASSQRGAVDCCNRWLPQILDQAQHLVTLLGAGAAFGRLHPGQFINIGSGSKSLLPTSGQDHHPHLFLAAQLLKTIENIPYRLKIQGIALLGTVQGHNGHSVPNFKQEIFVRHRKKPSRISGPRKRLFAGDTPP